MSAGASSKFIDKFKQFDAYAKTLEDFRVKTATGAIITLSGLLVITLLFLSEFQTYMSSNISEELFVDTTRGHKLRINLDIIVPRISCGSLTLDAMDVSGEQHLEIDHNIHKRRLDLDGKPIDVPIKEEIMTSTTVKQNTSETTTILCGSCYGAEMDSSQCCNSCEEVKNAYRMRRWALPDLTTIEQCKNESLFEAERANLATTEGCQIYGFIEVNRVGGSFHLAIGRSLTMDHIHVHDSGIPPPSGYNTTHIIKHLSFGTGIQKANTAPLDGVIGLAKEGGTMFQYYIKIVPTMYVKLDKTVLYTNQFSVTRHQRALSTLRSDIGIAGVFFNYELSPLVVKYTEKERSIGHLATNICAIVGGVFTVAGIVDALLYHSLNALQNKMVLGKTG